MVATAVGTSYLFCFALPALLAIVRPPVAKCRLARLDHVWQRRILQRILWNFLFDGDKDCPPAMGRMCQVFVKRIIAGFPAVEALFTKEADAVIGAFGARVEVEAGFG